MSKCRKWYVREPKFETLLIEACPQTPLEAHAFCANYYSLFSNKKGWNLCKCSVNFGFFGF